MDLAFESRLKFCSKAQSLVSILVLVDLAFEYIKTVDCLRKRTLVSILVLVDLAFEWGGNVECRIMIHSFNPCFSGSCIRIRQFFRIEWPIYSFNPCFSGSCIRIQPLPNFRFWILGFNPCFSGSCIRIPGVEGWRPSISTVSILVLVDLAFESLILSSLLSQSQCFNPCFSGSCIRIQCMIKCTVWKGKAVSILVLVDLAFEFFFPFSSREFLMVSILVLVDLAFEWNNGHDGDDWGRKFQSLF